MQIKTNFEKRKEVAKHIGEYIHVKAVYEGPPTFSYLIAGFNLDRNGIIHCGNEEEGKKLKEHLIELGYVEPEVDMLEISVPIESMDGLGMTNLIFEMKSKAYLLNRIVRREHFKVDDHVIKTLQEKKPEDIASFEEIIKEYHEGISGLKFEEDTVTFSFPTSDDATKNRAYLELAAMIVAHARDAKRISPNENKSENEKYYLRIWLLRLGLDGEGAKGTRKALLEGLKGHTAFRTAEDEAKHKAKYRERILQRKAGENHE